MLGDLVSTGLGQLGLNWQASPALTELEEVCLDWWRQMLGLSAGWSGVIQDTASTATLVALVCARERATNYSAVRGGLQAQPQPLMVYVSSQAHSSVEKAALLAGFGRENLRAIPVDENFDLDVDALDRGDYTGPRRRPSTLRHRRHLRHHRHDRLRSAGGRLPPIARARAPVAARRRRDGGVGHDRARVPRTRGRASRAPTRWW